ncbi:MAG: AarF/ABC1/UbiB kinase family protein, partial [Myxococcota bacterium]
LRTKAEPMGDQACLQVIEEELGSAPQVRFEAFDPSPIAAASIGQVYKAIYKGEKVCVKVQYPGITDATKADLKNINVILSLVKTLLPKVNAEQMIDDFRMRLVEECNYQQEAAYQKQFYELYREDPDILIPKVVEECSTSRVLTTKYIEGESLEVFLQNATQQERDLAGHTLFRLAFGTLLNHRLFHADPHPGNLLFRCGPHSKLGLLDFGCVQPINTVAQKDLHLMIRAAIDEQELSGPIERALGVNDIDDDTKAVCEKITRMLLAPILEPQPYRFTLAFAKDIARATIDAKTKMATGFLLRKRRFSVDREGIMFIVRNLFGLASIWGQLEAEGLYRETTESILNKLSDQLELRT